MLTSLDKVAKLKSNGARPAPPISGDVLATGDDNEGEGMLFMKGPVPPPLRPVPPTRVWGWYVATAAGFNSCMLGDGTPHGGAAFKLESSVDRWGGGRREVDAEEGSTREVETTGGDEVEAAKVFGALVKEEWGGNVFWNENR